MHTIKKTPTDDSSDDPLFDEDIPWTENLRRKEQDVIDHIIHGEESGHYFMLLGPKVRMDFEFGLPILDRFLSRVLVKAP